MKNSSVLPNGARRGRGLAALALALACWVGVAGAPRAWADDSGLTNLLAQIAALDQEKAARTPAQRKVSSQLLHALRQSRGEPAAPGVGPLRTGVSADARGLVLLDVTAEVTAGLLDYVRGEGGEIVASHPRFSALRARFPLARVEALAARADVRVVAPAVPARTRTGLLNSEGDVTHEADQARNFFRVTGAGVKVGVLSDSVDFLAQSQATGDSPEVTILPGQAGQGAGEGTAMIEIVHDLAPGAQIFYATAMNGVASFAQNILDLRAAGCDIIVDDVGYAVEAAFQDDLLAQAVNTVTADGAMYFSAAGNSGNKNDGTSGTWEGDFKDGGTANIGGQFHDWGGTNFNLVRAFGFWCVLQWSDALGRSTNDYDLYLVNANNNIVGSSTNPQNGTQDPVEYIYGGVIPGERVVVIKKAGEARFLAVDTGRGELLINTEGEVQGHQCAVDAYCVAAVNIATSFPNVFVGGVQNPVETFSSDGPRRVFYEADGTPITPGDYLATGGAVRQKPDIAAADGVQTTVPGFNPFFGTSAAAPHAAAIAALIKSYNPFLTPADIRQILTSTALDIEDPGVDRDAGWGLIMAKAALQATPPPVPLPNLLVGTNFISGGNGNGIMDVNECNNLQIVLTNVGLADATGVRVTVASRTPGVALGYRTAVYPDLPIGASATNATPIQVSTAPAFICGTPVALSVIVKCDQVTWTNDLVLPSGVVMPPLRFDYDVPTVIPDNAPGGIYLPVQVAGITGAVVKVTASLYIAHSFVSDLTLELISPDGLTNTLASGVGGAGRNFGVLCSPDFNRTTFDDAATASVIGSAPPYLGSYRPAQPLARFIGKSGPAVNGLWYLRVADNAMFDVGTLYCWSLHLSPAVCEDGGGECPGADLNITMSDSPDPVIVGSNLVYTIVVTNSGPTTAKGAVVSQILPPGTLFVSALPSQGSASQAGGLLTVNFGNINVGAWANVRVTVRPTTPGQIQTTATALSSEPDFEPGNNSVTVSTLVVPPTSDLALGLSAAPDPVDVGEILTYAVEVTNRGPSTATGIFVTNTLPLSVAWVDGSVSQGTVSASGNVVVCQFGALPANGRATAQLQVRPTAFGAIAATATVRANQTDPVLANNGRTVFTSVRPAANLGLALTASPNPAVVRSNLTYSLTVTNRGPNLATNVLLTHTLPVSVNVVSITPSQGTATNVGGKITTALGGLASGGAASVVVVLNTTNLGTLVSSAIVTAGQSDPDLSDNSASNSVLVATPFVSIASAGSTLKSESFPPANGAIDIGELVSVEFRLRNVGNVVNTNLVATLLATNGVTPTNTATQIYGVLQPGGVPVGRTFSFRAQGVSGGRITATFQLTDGANDLGLLGVPFDLPVTTTFANTNAIVIHEPGPQAPAPYPAAPYPSTVTVANLTGLVSRATVTLTGLTHTYPDDLDILLVSPGGQRVVLMSDAGGIEAASGVTLTFDDAAAGPVPDEARLLPGDYQLADYEPGDVYPSPAPAGAAGTSLGALAGANPNGVWSLYVVDDTSGDVGVISGGWSLSLSVVKPVNQIADLLVAGTASPDPVLVGNGLACAYTITNLGPNTANGVTLTNVLPVGVTLLDVVTSQGTYVSVDNTVAVSLGALAGGASATVTIHLRPEERGIVTNVATVAAGEIDLNTVNNTASVSATAELPVADLDLRHCAAPVPAVVGQDLVFSISVTNTGPNDALGVVVSNALPAGVAFVGAATSIGAVTNDAGIILATLGRLVPGEGAEVTLTVSPLVAGVVTNIAAATTGSSDPAPGNNTARVEVAAADPAPAFVVVGARLVSESNLPRNGLVDPGETVTISLSLSNTGSADAQALVATLQPTGGVTAPGEPTVYGAVPVGGVAAQPLSFTAAAGASSVTATVALADGTLDLGTVSYTFPVASQAAFATPAGITIPEIGAATPYPSTIEIGGLTGVVGKVTVKLSGFGHTFPDDVDIVLVGPGGQKVVLVSDVGGGHSVTGVNLTLDDEAAGYLPDATRLVSGTYRPTDYEAGETFPGVSKSPPGVWLATFNGTDPNGVWSLYVVDDTAGDSGVISGGWGLDITTFVPSSPLAGLSVKMTASAETLFTLKSLTYQLQVANAGPDSATDVIVTDKLPARMDLVSVTPSQGDWTNDNGMISCRLGTLASGASASITIVVIPTFPGAWTNSATVASADVDLNPTDNQAAVVTYVLEPLSAKLTGQYDPVAGTFQVLVTAQAGETYTVQGSADLVSWDDVYTAAADPNGLVKYTDTDAATTPHRFYRAKRIP